MFIKYYVCYKKYIYILNKYTKIEECMQKYVYKNIEIFLENSILHIFFNIILI